MWLRCLRNPRDGSGWNDLLFLTYPLILRIAARTARQWDVHDPEHIHDLAQDICLKICEQRGIELPADDSLVEPYLRVMAANAARDSLRTRFAGKRGVRCTVPMDDRMDSLREETGLTSLDRQVLLRQIDCLIDGSTRDRAIFWLHYRQGLTAREIAAIAAVELTSKGVESLLHRMLVALRARIARPAGEGAPFPIDQRRTDYAG